MGLFGFFNRSKFSKMSAQEKAREQGYAYLLCIEYAAESNRTEKGNDKVSDEDFKILSIASESINIGSEYLDCELRKSNFFDESEDGNHFKEVLFSLDLKTKRSLIKQMLIIYSNREKLENLLDENGDYILKGKYMTPIEKIAYLMGINEEVEDLVKDMIYEINKLELNDYELDNSENDLTKVISKSDEEDALKHLVIGISKHEIENYEGALEDYNKSINLNPNNARTYLEIGNAKLKLNDYKGAVLDYSKSIELDSSHADTYHNRSIAKSKLGDYQGVIDDCTKTIEIDNNYTRAYFNRGIAYANLQEFMEAIGDMNKVMELEPNNSNAYKNRGICMYEFEQYDSALKDLYKAMELDPNSNAYITIDKIKEELLSIEEESKNKVINTVETNYEFKNIIDSVIKNDKVILETENIEEIIKLFYNSLEKPTNIKGILLSPHIEGNNIIWKYDNPDALSFSTYILESNIEELFNDFCVKSKVTTVPSFPIFWSIDSPKILYINEELKSKIEKSLLEIEDLSLWDDNNSNLVCESKMDYWELNQEDFYTIYLEVGFNLNNIFIDDVSVDNSKASEWLEEYGYKIEANIDEQQLLDRTTCLIFEEETVADDSNMDISVSINYTCPEDVSNESSDVVFDDGEKKHEDLKDVIFNLDIEGTIFYPNEENKNDFFIAWAMSVITIDQDEEDCEFEILDIIKSELSDDKLIFANLGPNYETYRIVGLPEIQYFEFESSMSSLIAETNIKAAIEFLKNLKTINFSDLKSENNNFKFIKSNETEVIIEKTYHDNGELKEEFETLNGERHGYYKLYHDNGQLRVILQNEYDIQADGIVESLDENGFLNRSVFIKNGNLNGPFKEYYSSGKIKREGEYKDDEIIGIPIEYFEDGRVKQNIEDEELEDIIILSLESKIKVEQLDGWYDLIKNRVNSMPVEDFDDENDLALMHYEEYQLRIEEMNETEVYSFVLERMKAFGKLLDLIDDTLKDVSIDNIKLTNKLSQLKFHSKSSWISVNYIAQDIDFPQEMLDKLTPYCIKDDLDEGYFINPNISSNPMEKLSQGEEFISNAESEYKKGNFLEGINYCIKAIELFNFPMPAYLNVLAMGYLFNNDYDLAMEVIEKCIEEDDEAEAEYYLTKAKINIKLKNIQKAIEDYKKVLELDPDCEEAIQTLNSLENN